jgi:hypothetical protein
MENTATKSSAEFQDWTQWNFTPTSADIAAFNEATNEVGVGYKLIASRSRLVAGLHYEFLCLATVVIPETINYVCFINAYQAPSDKAKITGIKNYGPTPTNDPGGWINWNLPPTSESLLIFKTAMKDMVGVNYTPVAQTSQVVAGANYCFLAEGTVIVPNTPKVVALVYIFQPLPGNGNPRVTHIETIPTL